MVSALVLKVVSRAIPLANVRFVDRRARDRRGRTLL
jgi:hypothetical protein